MGLKRSGRAVVSGLLCLLGLGVPSGGHGGESAAVVRVNGHSITEQQVRCILLFGQQNATGQNPGLAC